MAVDMLTLSDRIDNFSPGSLACSWLLSFCCILSSTQRRGIFESETVALEGIVFSHLGHLQSKYYLLKKTIMIRFILGEKETREERIGEKEMQISTHK